MKPYGGYTLLMFAVSKGMPHMVDYLLSIGADVNEKANVI
jgi:ankyrin repeat protein